MGLTRNQSFQLPFLLGLMRTESFQPVALLGLIKGSCWRKCLDRYHRHHHRRPLQEVRHNSHPNTNASGKAGRYDVDAIGACCDRRAKLFKHLPKALKKYSWKAVEKALLHGRHGA